MIKARYIGIDCQQVLSGKVYNISTYCEKGMLRVVVTGKKFHYTFNYPSLEKFLKEWKLEAVYHGN